MFHTAVYHPRALTEHPFSADCYVTKNYTITYNTNDGQICGDQGYACTLGTDDAGPQSFQDTNLALDEFVSLTATIQITCETPTPLSLYINDGSEGTFPAPDTCGDDRRGNSAADCRVLTFTTTTQDNYVLGGQNTVRISQDDTNAPLVCFSYPQLETTVNSFTCETESMTTPPTYPAPFQGL